MTSHVNEIRLFFKKLRNIISIWPIETMIKSDEILLRGDSFLSVTIPFPNKRWYTRCLVPACLFIIALIAVYILNYVMSSYHIIDLYLIAIGLGSLILLIWATIFRSVYRLDIYEDEVIYFARLLFFKSYYIRKINKR